MSEDSGESEKMEKTCRSVIGKTERNSKGVVAIVQEEEYKIPKIRLNRSLLHHIHQMTNIC